MTDKFVILFEYVYGGRRMIGPFSKEGALAWLKELLKQRIDEQQGRAMIDIDSLLLHGTLADICAELVYWTKASTIRVFPLLDPLTVEVS